MKFGGRSSFVPGPKVDSEALPSFLPITPLHPHSRGASRVGILGRLAFLQVGKLVKKLPPFHSVLCDKTG